ncbi:MAG TPA: SRPBCC family protein [Acidimicrobiales bacterium]|jgi:carbon monoxide dehydrogenase subunit G|nr:SRPBCC family protein [Acidimicrobiales bacterium]
MHHETSIEIGADPSVVWATLVDVERWPEWTPSMTEVTRLDDRDLGVGSRVRIRQPRLPALVWTVTEYAPRASFTWASRAPGVTTTAAHRLGPPGPDGAVTVTLTVDQDGPLAPVMGRLMAPRTGRYIQMEAEGLKRRCEAG